MIRRIVAAAAAAVTVAALAPLAAAAPGDDAALAGAAIGPAPPEVAAEEYAARRQRVAEALGPGSLLLLLPGETAHRNGDVDWPFRQPDNLYYLTGVTQEGTALALIPGADLGAVLFARDRDPASEVWAGELAGHDALAAASGIAELAPSGGWRWLLEAALSGAWWGDSDLYRYYRPARFPAFLAALREGRATLWLDLGDRGRRGGPPTAEQELAAETRRRFPELRVRDVSSLIERLREVKSPAEIALLQRAVDVTVAAQEAGMRRTLTADGEHQAAAAIEHAFRDLGACCWGYPSIVAAGAHTTILHYPDADGPIDRDGLMLFDVGADYRGYTADVTRTFPADGTFSDPQREIYQAVLTAWRECLPRIRAGVLYADVHRHAVEVLARELHALGLVAAPEAEQAEMYFIHGLGHPIGLAVHDVFDRTRPLEPGMVWTLEPGLYVRRDDVEASPVFKALGEGEQQSIRRALDRYDGLGVRIEDDVLVTAGEPVVLSDALPRTVEGIEALLAAGGG